MTSHLYGLHERLRTPTLRKELEAEGLEELARWKKKLERDEVGPAMAAHLAQVFGQLGRALRDSDQRAWHQAVKDLEQALSAAGEPLSSLPGQLPELPFQQLLEILRPEDNVVGTGTTVRPDLPLGVSALLTGSARTPSLVSQLDNERQSADRADWLVSFIKWSGIRLRGPCGEANEPLPRACGVGVCAAASSTFPVLFGFGGPKLSRRNAYATG